jgi:hypothetical protein
MTTQDDDTQGNGQVVSWAFLSNGSGGQIDYNAVTGEVQAGVLDRGLDALTAFLHGCIWKPDYCHAGQTISVIYFDFDNDTIEAEDGAGKDTG